MKSLARLLTIIGLVVSSWGWLGTNLTAQAVNIGGIQFHPVHPVPVIAAEAKRLRNTADQKLADVYGDKIDLNNTNLRSFLTLPGFYPNLAGKIVQNAPYSKVEDVLNLEGLSARQKKRLEENLDKFIVTEPSSVFNEGDDRYNNGIYR